MPIGKKLKIFADRNFNSISDFARALGIKREQLYPYFKGEIIPGGEFLSKLIHLGCDINWLLTEETTERSVVKEPLVDYKIESLEKEKQKLVEENERLRNFINSASDLLSQAKLKKRGKR